MSWTNWVDKNLKWLSIPHLPLVLVGGQLLVFFASLPNDQIAQMLTLDRTPLIEQFQIWRLFSWIIVPSAFANTGLNVFLFFIELMVLWIMGQALENHWGSRIFTLYVLVGMVAGWVAPLAFDMPLDSSGLLTASIFFAFAYEFPDFEFLMFFILPVKVKWLALLVWAFGIVWFLGALALAFGGGVSIELDDGTVKLIRWGMPVMLAMGVANFFSFFGWSIATRTRGKVKRANMRAEAAKAEREPRHKCSVCGVTDFHDPELDFRYLAADKCICINCLDKQNNEA